MSPETARAGDRQSSLLRSRKPTLMHHPGWKRGSGHKRAPEAALPPITETFFFFFVTQEKFQNPSNVLRRPQREPGAPRISLGRPHCPHPHLPQPLQKPGFPSLSHTLSRGKPFNWADKTVSPNSEDREPRPPSLRP